MASYSYAAPHTLNWGWTLTRSFEAISPQSCDDLIHTFSQWSDGIGTKQHNVTIDDSHNSYSFTANFTSKPVTPDNFSGTTYNNHPKLSWDALTGDAISGYKVYRDYNKGGWQFVTNVTPKEEDDWIDYNYTTSGSPLYLTKYRITSYTSSAESDYTSIYTTYTRLALKGKSSEQEDNQIIAGSIISYNYPDPFNPETNISYHLSDAGKVTVKIFDIRGREVGTLLSDAVQQAGQHTVYWNGKDHLSQDVASGMYFYQVQFKDRYTIKKMLLIR